MDAIKILGQIAAAATTSETLYTVPADTSTTVSTLVVCNRTSGMLTFRVSAHALGEGADDKQFIFYDTPVIGNSTLTLTIGMTFTATDVVKTYASATGLSFNMFGAETSR